MKINRRNLFLASSATITLTLSAPTAHAQLYWDTNGATTGFGAAGGTWAAPTIGNATQGWSTDATGNTTPVNVTTTTADSLNFGLATAGNSMANGTITISGAVSAGNMTFGSNNGTAIDFTGGNLTLGTTTANSTIAVGGSTRVVTIASNIVGGNLTKAGTGVLVLSGNNTYTGQTGATGGTLRLASPTAVSGSSLVRLDNSGTTLEIATDTPFLGPDLTLGNNSLVVSDKATANTTGITQSFGDALFSGTVTMNFTAGSNVSGGDAAIQIQNLSISGGNGTLTLNPTTASLIIAGDVTGTGTANHTLAFTGNGSVNSIVGNITNGTRITQSLTKTGNSTLTLSGNNAYNGNTSVFGAGTAATASRLLIQSANALGSTAGVTNIGSGANLGQLQLAGNVTFAAETLNLLANSASWEVLQNVSGNNTWTGTIASASVAAANSLNIAAANATTLTISGNMSSNGAPFVLRGDGDIRISGVIANGVAATPGNITGLTSSAVGAGIRTLSGNNTYTGNTTINGGTLVVDDGSIASSASIVNNAALVYKLNANARTYANVISGNGSLTKSGSNSLTLSGNNTYSGNTTVSGGTLVIGIANSNNEASTVTIAPSAFLDLTFAGADTVDKLFIGATQQAAGTYGPTATGLAQIKNSSGNGTLKVLSGPPVTTGFGNWITQTFPSGNTVPSGQQGANQDPDNDGISNIVEYALEKDPTVSSQPAGALSGNTITYTKGAAAIANGDVSWTIETSTTLAAGSWTDAVTQPAGNTTATIAFTFTPSTPAKNFARLKVIQP
jgi:autotransporter-associated beta strand protein